CTFKEWVRTHRFVMCKLALAWLSSVALAMTLLPSKNLTVPVGDGRPAWGAATLAIRVTVCPKLEVGELSARLVAGVSAATVSVRSEERRVGKEGRSRGWPCQ